MSTLNVNTINAATSGQAVAVDVQNPRSNRRINENGACVIAQRGTSSTSTEYQTVDRWRSTFSQVSVTTTQHALTDADTGPWEKGFRYSYHLENTSTSSATNAWTEFGTRIEAQNICNSGWVHSSTSSYITYSFWAKSSLAGTYYTWLRSKDSTNKVYASSFVLVANTWKKVSFTVPGAANVFIDNNNGVGLNVNISPYWGTDYTDSGTGTGSWVTFVSGTRLPDYAQNWCNTANATFEATGLQLEAGSYATDFEHRSYGDELARCMRYFIQYDRASSADDGQTPVICNVVAGSSDDCFGAMHLPVPMRAAPTIGYSDADHFQLTRVFSSSSTVGGSISIAYNTFKPHQTMYIRTASSPDPSFSGGDTFTLRFINAAFGKLTFSSEL